MTSKHIFNSQQGLVVKSLQGLVASNPTLRLNAANKVVFNAQADPSHVSVISGGGAGHEPFAAAYVGTGMLTAAVSGEIFASPSTGQISSALNFVPTGQGVLFVILNYTGDCLNFGLAAEKARARGIKATLLVVGDDVAVGRARGGLVGRRGLAGCVLVCKILGAAAAKGMPLEALFELGQSIVANLATVGLSLDHCHVPGQKDWTPLPLSHCELGMGIHNESGVRSMDSQPASKDMIAEMLSLLINNDADRAFVKWKDSEKDGSEGAGPVLMVNNLGGISTLEMGAVTDEVVNQLSATYTIYPSRVYNGVYMTSLNGPGFSITLLNSTGTVALKEASPVMAYLDYPTLSTGWSGAHGGWVKGRRNLEAEQKQVEALASSAPQTKEETKRLGPKNPDPKFVERAISLACKRVIESEPDLTKWDTQVGDGDCGTTFANAAQAILDALGTAALPTTYASQTIASIVQVLEPSMGGTSGALFSLYLTALSAALQTSPWSSSAYQALEALQKYTPAREGDRTLVDSLSPFCTALKEGKGLGDAAKAAQTGAEKTRGMKAKLGRATYVGDGTEKSDTLPPDPGAWGVAALLQGLAEGAQD